MSESLPTVDPPTLALAWKCAEAGDVSGALLEAAIVLEWAQARSDARLRAEALLCQASCELRLRGHFDAALQLAQRAGSSYRQAQDVRGECAALATQAIAASRLGVYEAAVDCAMLAIRITQPLPACRERAMAYEALGVAMFLGACYDEASSAFHQALEVARACEPPLSTLELHTNLASAEAHRYQLERIDGGRRLSLEMLEYHLERCAALETEEGGACEGVAPAGQINNAFILAFTRAKFLAWKRRTAEARVAVETLQALLARHDRPWTAGALCWVQAEMHLCDGRTAEALACALEMEAIAARYRHDSMLGAAIQLQRVIHDATGDLAGTVTALRKLVDRSQRSRTNSLKGRVAFIDREIELRGKTSDIERLESDSRLFERMAFEDALTGLPNRRKFEQAVHAFLEAGPNGLPLCLVMIDVNRFKRINDDFSHNVGDDVLRGIGGILRVLTREHDLAARLAGDEFVLVLRGVTPDATAVLCQRMRDAVRDFDWEAVAEGLSVSISVGVTVAQPGDTLVELLARSDRSMYADKRASTRRLSRRASR